VRIKRVIAAIVLVIVLGSGVILALLMASLPQEAGEIGLPGLSAMVTVHSDALANPTIIANNRADAFRSLGYLHARDRLFQMELMRRKSAGRLAELFGASAVKLDRQQRTYQLSKVARQIVADLPTGQRKVLQAYVAGVNSYIGHARIPPPEFLALQHRPEPWREEDSILVVLGMFQNLNGQEQDERMVSVMEKALPADLVKFLTPDTDSYATVLVGGQDSRRFSNIIPTWALAALPDLDAPIAKQGVDAESIIAGSNNWVVAGSKTADGRAIVANDMHLSLGIPNVWYRAALQYQNRHIYGVTLPGVPGVIVGGNNDVAWGFTNVTADLLDLIRLETNPDNPLEYRTAQGWVKFGRHYETLYVKGAANIEFEVRDTLWGPVSEQALLASPVAIKWTALEKHAVDLGLLEMDQVQSTQQAIRLLNHTGGPPQNVVLADRNGHIGWTYMGRFPHRVGFEGIASRSWADGRLGWQGYIAPERLPRLFDPPEGFIVTANNRTLGRGYPETIAYNWGLGYRAFRISELLRGRNAFTEKDLFAIQLDTRSAVFDFYQQLALAELRNIKDKAPALAGVEHSLQSWDGYMNADSTGAAFLSEFRSQLAEAVFARVVASCRVYDPNFNYAWREMETPLRLLLTQKPEGILGVRYHNSWQEMIRDALRRTGLELQRHYPGRNLAQLTWGETNPISLHHPFSGISAILAPLLDMPTFASDGCSSLCVKTMGNSHGASERLILAPAYPENAIFHMPGGQSGHALSRHYRDQQPFWQNAIASPLLLPSPPAYTLRFTP
jgi:penicillin G amidase